MAQFLRSTFVVCAALAAPALAQTLADMTQLRNPVMPYRSLLEVEAGAIGTVASEEFPGAGLEDAFSWDGHIYYRDEDFGDRKGTLVGYAGRDGLYAGIVDGQIVGDETVTKLEIRARPWQFYRDGYYRDDAFVPNGLYDGTDYEGYLGFGREVSPGLFMELGPYYRDHRFDRSDLTDPSFNVPVDFASYGVRVYLEQQMTQLDRRRGTPRDGGVASFVAEQEWNDSTGSVGVTGGFQTELPAQVWRLRGRYDWYIPSSDNSVWEIFAIGGWSDRKDRVQNFEAQRVLGHQWVDGTFRLRIHIGSSWVVTPFAQGQFARVVGEGGDSSTSEIFFGGGVESYLHFSDSISMRGYYSFLNNESRPSIKIDEDVHGEHMFFLGLIMRFGGQRR